MRFWGVFQRETKSEIGHPSKSIFPLRLSSFCRILNYYFTTVAPIPGRTKGLICLKPSLRRDLHDIGLQNFFPHLSGVSSFKGCLRLATFTTTTTQARKRLHRVRRPRFSCFGTQGVFERGHFHNFNNRSPEKQVYSWGSRPRKRILVLWRRAASRRGANLHRNLHLRRKNRPHLHLQ